MKFCEFEQDEIPNLQCEELNNEFRNFKFKGLKVKNCNLTVFDIVKITFKFILQFLKSLKFI